MLNAVLGMPLGDLLTFVLAGLVLNLTPGADVIFAVSCGAAGGARAGAAAWASAPKSTWAVRSAVPGASSGSQ